MGKISEILLKSLFISSAYANNFAVPSCNNDSEVSLAKFITDSLLGVPVCPTFSDFHRSFLGPVRDYGYRFPDTAWDRMETTTIWKTQSTLYNLPNDPN